MIELKQYSHALSATELHPTYSVMPILFPIQIIFKFYNYL